MRLLVAWHATCRDDTSSVGGVRLQLAGRITVGHGRRWSSRVPLVFGGIMLGGCWGHRATTQSGFGPLGRGCRAHGPAEGISPMHEQGPRPQESTHQRPHTCPDRRVRHAIGEPGTSPGRPPKWGRATLTAAQQWQPKAAMMILI